MHKYFCGKKFGTFGGEVGGIAGSCWGEVKRCINYGMVYGVCSNNLGSTNAGGICGNSLFSSNVAECCNMGEVLVEGQIYHRPYGIGGVIGKDGKTVNCYNRGSVIGIDGLYAGGITGTSSSERIMQNSYSVGNVTNGYPGAITSVYGDCIWELSNCYWLTGTAADGVCETGRVEGTNEPQDISSVFEYNRTQMTSLDFVNELNANCKRLGYDEVWAADTQNINNGYPILKNVPYTIDDLTGSVYDDFDYKIIEQRTIEITKYKGSDTEVEIPAQIDGKPVSSIGMSAFYGCTGITKVSCPDNVVKIEGYAFQNCSKLKEIDIPSAVTEIGKYAFANCNELKQVTIPAGVSKIEEHTFLCCSSLAEVVFLNNPESIDGWAFWGCTSLNGIQILHVYAKWQHLYNWQLNKSKASVKQGKSVKLSVRGLKNTQITWKTSNKKIAAVSKNGVVKAKKAGIAVITAVTPDGSVMSCNVTVGKKAKK